MANPKFEVYTDKLLDYFAAKAMQGMLSNGQLMVKFVNDPALMAEHAYNRAEAMMAEREKRSK